MDAVEPPPLEEIPEPTSVAAKLFNVIAAPGDVFEELRFAKVRLVNWLVPLLLMIAVTCVFTFSAFRNPAVVHGIQEQQAGQIRKSMAGRKGMTEEKIEKAVEGARKFMTPTMLSIIGMTLASLAVVVFLFGQGFVLWVVDRAWLRTGTDLMRFVEICGVAESINVLSTIVRIFIVQGTGNMQVGTSPALLLKPFDPTNPGHLVLNNVELFFLWYLAVVALGISVVTRTTYLKSLVGAAVVWLAMTALAVLPALAAR